MDAIVDDAVVTEPEALDDEQRQLVLDHVNLAKAVARRFRSRGEPLDELEQVALLALVKVAYRFEPEHMVKFSTFATVSLVGELKRHFRDRTWGVRVARSVKETALNVYATRAELEHELRRCPTVTEIASRLQTSEEVVLEAMEAGYNRFLASLDAPVSKDGNTLIDNLVSDEDPYSPVLDRHRLQALIPTLAKQEQLVLSQYFFDDRTQQQIGTDLGVSQMQVSRILTRSLRRLRARW